MVIKKGRNQGGFTLIEMLGVLAIIVILAGLVGWGVMRATRHVGPVALAADIRSVQEQVGVYSYDTNPCFGHPLYPTESGGLPPEGQSYRIDWYASYFDPKRGEVVSFYPDYIRNLPRHHNEGVWRIDSSGVVWVDIDPNKY